jgi:hypothetical protein
MKGFGMSVFVSRSALVTYGGSAIGAAHEIQSALLRRRGQLSCALSAAAAAAAAAIVPIKLNSDHPGSSKLDLAVAFGVQHQVMAVIAQCSQGALFETLWVPRVSFKAVRLGKRRLQRCPVHRRWQFIHRIDPTTLTVEQRADAAQYRARRLL